MGQPLNVGIIGCGTIVGAYLATFPRLKAVKLSAAADIDAPRAEAVGDPDRPGRGRGWAGTVPSPVGGDPDVGPDLRPDGWTIRSIVDRIDRVGDRFATALGHEQRLPLLAERPPRQSNETDRPRTKAQLYADATRKRIKGRSRMSRAELERAVRG